MTKVPQTKDEDGMEMPVPCSNCGNLIELNDANFFVKGFCDCVGRCGHGLCDDCKDQIEEDNGQFGVGA